MSAICSRVGSGTEPRLPESILAFLLLNMTCSTRKTRVQYYVCELRYVLTGPAALAQPFCRRRSKSNILVFIMPRRVDNTIPFGELYSLNEALHAHKPIPTKTQAYKGRLLKTDPTHMARGCCRLDSHLRVHRFYHVGRGGSNTNLGSGAVPHVIKPTVPSCPA